MKLGLICLVSEGVVLPSLVDELTVTLSFEIMLEVKLCRTSFPDLSLSFPTFLSRRFLGIALLSPERLLLTYRSTLVFLLACFAYRFCLSDDEFGRGNSIGSLEGLCSPWWSFGVRRGLSLRI